MFTTPGEFQQSIPKEAVQTVGAPLSNTFPVAVALYGGQFIDQA